MLRMMSPDKVRVPVPPPAELMAQIPPPEPHRIEQFWIVLSGTASAAGGDLLPPNSCVFVAPDDGKLSVTAGGMGAEALCLQFPVLARH